MFPHPHWTESAYIEGHYGHTYVLWGTRFKLFVVTPFTKLSLEGGGSTSPPPGGMEEDRVQIGTAVTTSVMAKEKKGCQRQGTRGDPVSVLCPHVAHGS